MNEPNDQAEFLAALRERRRTRDSYGHQVEVIVVPIDWKRARKTALAAVVLLAMLWLGLADDSPMRGQIAGAKRDAHVVWVYLFGP